MSEAHDEHLVRLTELDDAWRLRGAGARLEAVRHGARRLRDRILASGLARCVRTADLATFPYPTTFGLQGVAASPAPYVFMRNRMQLVQLAVGQNTITILVNPTDTERSSAAPFFARMLATYGPLAKKLLSTVHSTIPAALAGWGIDPAEIDYVAFDHLHVQDVRGLLGPGGLLPKARLLIQRSASTPTFRS